MALQRRGANESMVREQGMVEVTLAKARRIRAERKANRKKRLEEIAKTRHEAGTTALKRRIEQCLDDLELEVIEEERLPLEVNASHSTDRW